MEYLKEEFEKHRAYLRTMTFDNEIRHNSFGINFEKLEKEIGSLKKKDGEL